MKPLDVMPAAKDTEKKRQKERQKQLTEALKAVQQQVKTASQVPDILQHFPVFASYSKDSLAATVSFTHASELSEEQKTSVWELFEANMKEIYQQDGQKWQPREKRRELFHDEARYFLVTDPQARLLAFTHFRFEVEENLLAEEEMQRLMLARYDPVAYCYELQLDSSVHGKGLGKRLMQMLELVALKYGMHMVMLTVQKSNTPAWGFYSRLGYKQHPSCPERNAFEDFDGEDPGHRILFKDLRRK